MPEEIEVETSELQEAIDELHKERSEREQSEKATGWTKYIGLTTAILAVFAAVGALRGGSLVNEAMIAQLKASDTWNEYQAAKQKSHLYTVAANSVLDSQLSKAAQIVDQKFSLPSKSKGEKAGKWSEKPAAIRAKEYESQVGKEEDKSKDLSEKAKEHEKESEHLMHGHHQFAMSVALIQVAIALGAISALTKIKPVWLMSMAVGATGLVLCIMGLISSGF